MPSSSSVLESLLYRPASPDDDSPASLQVLDQLLLPDQKVYLAVPNVETTWSVIHKMQIRGAPLIAVVAVLGLAVHLQTVLQQQELLNSMTDDDQVLQYLQQQLDYLATSRPTAVNLFHALEEVRRAGVQAVNNVNDTSNTTAAHRVVQAVTQHAEFMLARDRADNRAIGQVGCDAILSSSSNNNNNNPKITVLTICNTGSLATAGYGTALGVVRALHAAQRLEAVAALETRPYNQGSRLTCFELLQDQIPGAVLICDGMVAAYLSSQQQQHRDSNVVVVVGADRVAANGDAANKIGTLQLAVTAHHFGVPFYVAAPLTTVDLEMASGAEIDIEERPAKELLETSRAPQGMPVWNPA